MVNGEGEIGDPRQEGKCGEGGECVGEKKSVGNV